MNANDKPVTARYTRSILANILLVSHILLFFAKYETRPLLKTSRRCRLYMLNIRVILILG